MARSSTIQQDYNAALSNDDFDSAALELYRHQYSANPLYRQFSDALRRTPDNVQSVVNIPFLPISFFKSFEIKTGIWQAATEFHSSGTTGMDVSRHLVDDPERYTTHALTGFEHFYGPLRDRAVLALLPSYLERSTSSLVAMAKRMIEESGFPESGFYLHNLSDLAAALRELEQRAVPAVLLGVTFALLDFAEMYPMELRHTIVMETGGMKGRREELTREEVHAELQRQLGLDAIHAEYGMTELYSQAYAREKGLFQAIPGMKVLVRDLSDPLTVSLSGSGALNIIDLANRHSCAFIATEDTGHVYADGRFEVRGRMDHSVLRGCSLMAV